MFREKKDPKLRKVTYDYQIFSQQTFGGISRYFCEIASRIHGNCGWHAKVVAPVFFNQYLADSDIPVQGVYIPAPYSRIERLFDLFNRQVEPYFLHRSGADILHQTYYSATVPECAARRVVTVFDMIHELYPQYFSPRDLIISRYKRQAVGAASHVVCISQQTADDLMEILAVPRKKITVTHLGFSPVFEQSAVTPAGLLEPAGRRPYFLYVGQRAGYKNFSRLLEAFAGSRRLADEFDLVSFGGRPFTRDELDRFKELRLRPGAVVQMAGDDLALARVYREARAFVYPSEYEGFGIPPLEAMASGCPVACSNQSCMPEIVGNAAQYFDPTQVDSVRAALECLAFNDARRSELIAAGRLQCRRFSWQRCAAETLAAYEKALG